VPGTNKHLLKTPCTELSVLSVQGVCKYLAGVCSTRLGSAGNRGGSGAGGTADVAHSTGSSTPSAEVLRHVLRNSKGKQLLELVELLGGKAVSRKVCGYVVILQVKQFQTQHAQRLML